MEFITEYTGQLVGGPDDGNFVTSTRRVIRCEVVYRHWLNGTENVPTVTRVRGNYVWAKGVFEWKANRG